TAGTAGTLSSFDVPSAALPHVAMLDRSVNQDGCKGATVNLTYTIS
ncbi:MAG: hypothetical protein QOD98_1089, partial [Nocardioidaceae bacterium]|nr:hypothetical protein [Nocardioidaceae bacterium]